MQLLAAGLGGVVAEKEAGAFDAAPVVFVEVGRMLIGAVMINYEG